MTTPSITQDRILILDFGSQYSQLIARRVREAGVYSEMYAYDMDEAAIRAFNPKGIILSGGPESVHMENSPRAPQLVFELGVPVLGIFWLLVTTLPFLFIALTSFKTQQETFAHSVWALPEKLNFANYLAVLQGGFGTYLRNSVFVVAVSILLILLMASMAAFALARLKFRLNKPLFSLIVAMMLPSFRYSIG